MVIVAEWWGDCKYYFGDMAKAGSARRSTKPINSGFFQFVHEGVYVFELTIDGGEADVGYGVKVF